MKSAPRQNHYYLLICHHDVTLLLICFISSWFLAKNTSAKILERVNLVCNSEQIKPKYEIIIYHDQRSYKIPGNR